MMNMLWPKPGKYIVAVSGGVDSVCLLDMLVAHGGYELVVAHVDHGIRDDSEEDAQFVSALAARHAIPCFSKRLNLTITSSEERLRAARYQFLFETMQQTGAKAILTAHHADDLLETSIMNVRRGTDRYGAAGGMSRAGIIRPLINVYKQELISYAKTHQLEWHEDSTNSEVTYTRNKVRHEVIPTINTSAYLDHLDALSELNVTIDSELAGLVSIEKERIVIPRATLNQLGLRQVEVLLAYALRQIRPSFELSQPQIARLSREMLLSASKNSFSYPGLAGIIIVIQ